MSWFDKKYISLLSSRLDNYRKKSENLYNFSCPLCNDLEAHPHQGRGYIFEKKGDFFYFCHYCSKSFPFFSFLKEVDVGLFNQYMMEKIKDSKPKEEVLETFASSKPVFKDTDIFGGMKTIAELTEGDAYDLVKSRKIPESYYSKMYLVPNFMQWVNTFIPNKYKTESFKYDEQRIVFPFYNKDKKLHAVQGRVLKGADPKVKYMTIIIDDDVPKIYGLDTVNENKDIFVHEAIFDAIFIPNSVSTAGGDLVSTVSILPKDKCVICYDNEPRKRETVIKMKKAIINGHRVCFWPESYEYKDINEAIIKGMNAKDIEQIIRENSSSGLEAKLTFSKWRKI